MSFQEWLTKIRSLVNALAKISPEQKEKRQQAQAALDAAYAPSSLLPELPMGQSIDIGSPLGGAEGRKKACERLFGDSELWDKGFELDQCTKTGWAILMRLRGENQPPACIALHPEGTLFVSLEQSRSSDGAPGYPNFSAKLIFPRLRPSGWLLGPDDKARYRVAVDGQLLKEAVDKIGVSETPPLRYHFGIATNLEDLNTLARGRRIVAGIAKESWGMGLRGSSRAIKAVKLCAYRVSRAKYN